MKVGWRKCGGLGGEDYLLIKLSYIWLAHLRKFRTLTLTYHLF